MEAKNTYTNDHMLDVAIVSGGVSGVYSSWRLIISDKLRKKSICQGFVDKYL